MTDHLTETDRALCEALGAAFQLVRYGGAGEYIANGDLFDAAGKRIRELSRQLAAAEADAARLAEALGEAIEGLEDSGKHTYARDCAEALAEHALRKING